MQWGMLSEWADLLRDGDQCDLLSQHRELQQRGLLPDPPGVWSGLLFHRRDVLQWGVYAQQHDDGHVRRRVLHARAGLCRHHVLSPGSSLRHDLLSSRSDVQQRHLLSDWPGEREWDLPVLLTNWVRYLPRRTGLREWRLPVLHTNWVHYLHCQPGLPEWGMLHHLPWTQPRLC